MWSKKLIKILNLEKLRGAPSSLALDKQTNKLFSSNTNGLVQIWNTETCLLENFINTGTNLLKDIIIYKDKIFLLSIAGYIFIYNKYNLFNISIINIFYPSSGMTLFKDKLVISTKFFLKYFETEKIKLIKEDLRSGLEKTRCITSNDKNIFINEGNFVKILN